MALDPGVAVLALSPALTAAVLGWFTLRQRTNGRNGRRPTDPTSDPHGTKLGDVPAAWWMDYNREFMRELRAMRAVVETHMKLHH